jgi:FkbM family methyltransferase
MYSFEVLQLIPLVDMASVLGFRCTSVLHVGAHHGEERDTYFSLGWIPIAWIEANPYLVEVLERQCDPRKEMVVEGAAWAQSGLKLQLNLMNDSQTSSLSDFIDYSRYPNLTKTGISDVSTVVLSDVLWEFNSRFDSFPNYLHLDIQGSELEALRGTAGEVSHFDVIYPEVATREVYRGQPLVNEIDLYLACYGFKRLITRMVPLAGWGDAAYVQSTLVKNLSIVNRYGLLRFKVRLACRNARWRFAITMKKHKIRSWRKVCQ